MGRTGSGIGLVWLRRDIPAPEAPGPRRSKLQDNHAISTRLANSAQLLSEQIRVARGEVDKQELNVVDFVIGCALSGK